MSETGLCPGLLHKNSMTKTTRFVVRPNSEEFDLAQGGLTQLKRGASARPLGSSRMIQDGTPDLDFFFEEFPFTAALFQRVDVNPA